MRLVNNNISPLPFYDSLSMQNHRKKYAYGQVYPLITYKNFILPFQIVVDSGISIEKVHVVDFNSGGKKDVTRSLFENGLNLKQFEDFGIIKYPGQLPIKEIEFEGFYYLEILLSKGAKYSDIFCVTNRVDDYVVLEYGNSYNFRMREGMVDFSDNFKFKCYLNTQIGKPNYSFEEEVTERMGYSFIESQVSKKEYKFSFVAPEYLCDALRIVRLCDFKVVSEGENLYNLTNFNMNPKWEDQGDLASVECKFETDTVIANIGGFQPELIKGQFSADFNDDFNKE